MKLVFSPRRRDVLQMALAAVTVTSAGRSVAQQDAWRALVGRARGQTVFLNAWGGSERTNAYLQWAAVQLDKQFGVELRHVKLTDTAEAVKRVRGEKQAGRTSGGSVDAIWINGENFLTMKREGLLFGPFAESLPGFRHVDVTGKPTTRMDFSEPVAGMEAPWGMAQFTFFADRRRLPSPPADMRELLELAKQQPGRITYPRPPNFHGTTFLKQALLELTPDRAGLYAPYSAQAFDRVTGPLWQYLDALRPHLWRQGRQYPQNAGAQRQMMADGELVLALTFNPNEAANEIAAKRLSADVVSLDVARSSTNKGETILDTIANLTAMHADMFVVRHSESGAPYLIAQHAAPHVHVVNAGDGRHEHPTQGLLDMFTIRKYKKDFTRLTVAIVGDILHSRVARSQIHALTTLGVPEVRVIGPRTLLPADIERLGVRVFTSLEEGLKGVDVVTMLRLQNERMNGALLPSASEYFSRYGLTPQKLALAKPDAIVLHPGPMNRGVEIDSAVADGKQSVILPQVTYGIAVRMAVMAILAGSAR